jgi:hypothetical protein
MTRSLTHTDEDMDLMQKPNKVSLVHAVFFILLEQLIEAQSIVEPDRGVLRLINGIESRSEGIADR